MTKHILKRILPGTTLVAGFLTLFSAYGTASEGVETINDYPTQTRVEYVLQCMQKHGGQHYDTLYPCVCVIDKLATKLSHEEFEQAKTFGYLRSLPGEAGGIFRDPPKAKELKKRLEEAEQFAESTCFVK